jgi:hypothetical protein
VYREEIMKDSYEIPVVKYIKDKIKNSTYVTSSNRCTIHSCDSVSCGQHECAANICGMHNCNLDLVCNVNICTSDVGCGPVMCTSNVWNPNICTADLAPERQICKLNLFVTAKGGPTFSIGRTYNPKNIKYYNFLAKQLTPERLKLLEEANKIRYKPKFDFKQWEYAMEKNDPELLTKTDIDDLFDMIGKVSNTMDKYYDARKSKASNNNTESKI